MSLEHAPEARALKATAAADDRHPPTADGRPLRVLLVKDSAEEADLLLRALGQGGLDPAWERVETADGLRAALAAGPWDAVVSDYALPGLGAPAALAVVREADLDLPFIVVSGTVGEDAAVELMRASANDYILKRDLARLAPTVEREVREAGNRRARRTAARVADLLAAVVESSDDAILSNTLDGVITTWNPAAERLYGWTAAEAVGRHVSILIPPDKADEWAGSMGRLVAGERVGYLETVRLHRDGRRIDVAMTISWVRDAGGRLVGVSKTARDIQERKRAEEVVRRAEARYRGLIESIPALVWVYDPTGRPLLHNRRWYEYTGQRPEDIASDRWHEALHPDDAAGAVAAWGRSLAGGEPYSAEYRLRRSDGAYRWFLSQATAMGGPGAIEQWVGICTDITDRKRAEGAVRASEHNLNQAQRIAHLGHWEQDLDTGRITASDETHRIFGLPPREGLGTWEAWQGYIHPDDRPDRAAAIDRALREGRPYEAEYRVVRPDGDTRVLECQGEATRADAGQPPRLFGIVRDITEYRRAERALRDAERRLEHVVASSPAVLFTIRVEGGQFGDIEWMSQNVEGMLGYRVEETLGAGWWTGHIHPADRDAVVAQFGAEIFSHNSFSAEYRFRHRDGRYRWIRGETRLLRDAAGSPAEVVGSLSDITERKALEDQFRQSQKMDAFGQLAGGVAHDFNNLLTIINGYSDLLLGSLPAGDPGRELAAEIHRAGERSAGLTRQLLAFSRQQVLAPRVLDLNAVVGDTASLLRRVIGEDVTLSTTTAPALWPVKADPGQVEQVLMNLAVNARDAMPTGGRLTIETQNVDLGGGYAASHPGARPGPHVLLAVSDTGCGMTPAVLAKVFEPFFTTKEPGKGTGLGLATVYGIVQQSGGHVGVYSEVGVGTTFKVYLPRTEHASGVTKARSAVRSPPRGTETVLVVEDDAAVRALTRRVLLGAGYTVLEAAGGDGALQAAAAHTGAVHLLVTDVVMPGLGGRAVAERLTESHPGLRVLFVSGYTDDAVVRHGVLHETVNFLQKPFTPAALAWKVREVLDDPPA